jgi:S-adenosylmethionine decarboxylase
LYECPAETLNDRAYIGSTIREAVEHADATLLQQVSCTFSPQGVTALALLSESHISIHTWPECGYAAADIFTCGTRARPDQACQHLVKALGAGRHEITRIERGTDLEGDERREAKPFVAVAAHVA